MRVGMGGREEKSLGWRRGEGKAGIGVTEVDEAGECAVPNKEEGRGEREHAARKNNLTGVRGSEK